MKYSRKGCAACCWWSCPLWRCWCLAATGLQALTRNHIPWMDARSFHTRMPLQPLKRRDYRISVYIRAHPPYPMTQLSSSSVTRLLRVILGSTLKAFHHRWSQNIQQRDEETLSKLSLSHCFTPNYVSRVESVTHTLMNIPIRDSRTFKCCFIFHTKEQPVNATIYFVGGGCCCFFYLLLLK